MSGGMIFDKEGVPHLDDSSSQMPYLPAKVHQLMPSAATHRMLLRVLAASDFECLHAAGRN